MIAPSRLSRPVLASICIVGALLLLAGHFAFRPTYSLGSLFEIRAKGPRLRTVDELQQLVYETAHEKWRYECSWHNWHEERYHDTLFAKGTNIFMAMNFYENEDILPAFFQELPVIADRFGPERLFVSIYENGSQDKTRELLQYLAEMLDTLGVAHRVLTFGETLPSHKEDGHRIDVLAKARNLLLEPLLDGSAAKLVPGNKFDDVLFVNDVAHCAADLVEIVYQRHLQGAYQSCGADWGGWGGQVIYDRWVLRSMTGRPWYRWRDVKYYYEGAPWPEDVEKPYAKPLLDDDPESLGRFQSNLPLQVFSCWNGASAFAPEIFFPPNDIRFRQAYNDFDEDGSRKEITEKASECYLISVDLWKKGLGKILLVPKASVSYQLWDYWAYRKDGPIPVMVHNPATELVKWKSEPPPQVAMQDWARWDEDERWAPWDEA